MNEPTFTPRGVRKNLGVRGKRDVGMSVALPSMPSYQFGSYVRRSSPPDDLKIQSLARPKSASPGVSPHRAPFAFRYASGEESLMLRRPDGSPWATRTSDGAPRPTSMVPLRPDSAKNIREVSLPGPNRGSEIMIKTIDTWIPRTMPGVPSRPGPTPVLRMAKPSYAYPTVGRPFGHTRRPLFQ